MKTDNKKVPETIKVVVSVDRITVAGVEHVHMVGKELDVDLSTAETIVAHNFGKIVED